MQTKIEWFGHGGHFCASEYCDFRLHTLVDGKYVISTIGDYFPGGNRKKKENVGCDRLFETCVFRATGECMPCGCPRWDGLEIDMLPAQTAIEARDNHMAMIEKYAVIAQSHESGLHNKLERIREILAEDN